MSISARNIFNYDSLLSKRIQLDNREYQIRQKERDLLGQALMQRNAQPDQQAALIRSQRFFELGFEEGFKRAQAGETEVPEIFDPQVLLPQFSLDQEQLPYGKKSGPQINHE